MLRFFFLVAVRNLLRHRLHTVLNLTGLAVGMAACLLILLFMRNELSYDGFFRDADRIYQVTVEWRLPGRPSEAASLAPHSFGPAFRDAHPDAVQDFTRFTRGRNILRAGDRQFYEWTTTVDPTFLDIFPFPLLAGDAATALADPSSIVLTEAVARKLFGDEPAVGRLLTVDGKHEVRVTAVVAKLPPNTHLTFDVLLPQDSPVAAWMRELENHWGSANGHTYIRLRPGAEVDPLLAGMRPWVERTFTPLQTSQGLIDVAQVAWPSLRHLTDVHLEPLIADVTPGITHNELATFTIVALLILAIASINFMNLATARATQRAREVGMRKVMGASRAQLASQFLGESMLMVVLSLFMALTLVELALPFFNALLGKDLTLNFGVDPWLAVMPVLMVALVGIGGGAYPAFLLSSFAPAQAMKGVSTGPTGSGRLRALLVVAQFAISIALMVATTVVYWQFIYAQEKDLGYQTENVVVVDNFTDEGVSEKRDTFMEILRADPMVAGVGAASFTPGDEGESYAMIRRTGDGAPEEMAMRQDDVGYDFLEALGMRMVTGRTFDRARGTDAIPRPDGIKAGQTPPDGVAKDTALSAGVILNRSGVKALAFDSPEAAIGQKVVITRGSFPGLNGTIIGVVEDFHYNSVHELIRPAMYLNDETNHRVVAVRAKAGQLQAVVDRIDRIWPELVPDRPIQRSFFDVNIANQYQREKKISQMFATFSGLAIFISCLGLYGLASFTAERRTKEIGLRKVLGASVMDIVRLLVWQFSKPVLVANLIAWPVAWFCMDRWLSDFTYRIDLNPLLFLGAGSAALAIAWVTVGLHAARVAQAKPVKALRYE